VKRRYKNLLAAGTLASALTCATAAFAQATIKLGVLLPVSGGAASVGLGIQDGIKLAVEEINAAGGVSGKKLEYLVRDTQLKPDLASAAAKELLTKEGVRIFIGPATSGESLAVSEFAKNEKVVNIAPSATTESLTSTNLHDYIFQLPTTTDLDGVRNAQLLNEIGAKSVCFAGYDYAYTTDFFKAVRANLGDVKDAGNFLVPLGTTDYSTMVTQLVSSSCDTILGTVWGGGFIAFVKQASPFGLFKNKKLIWGANMGEYAVAVTLKADFPEGMWASASDVWYVEYSDAHKKFQTSLAKLQGRKETGMWPITGYNAVYFAKAAIEKAGSADPTAIAAAMKGLTIASPLGDLTIDAKTHRANSPQFFGQIATVKGSDVKQMTNVRLVK
jgi:branched-chain amino acid transport system substrate-binding protein